MKYLLIGRIYGRVMRRSANNCTSAEATKGLLGFHKVPMADQKEKRLGGSAGRTLLSPFPSHNDTTSTSTSTTNNKDNNYSLTSHSVYYLMNLNAMNDSLLVLLWWLQGFALLEVSSLRAPFFLFSVIGERFMDAWLSSFCSVVFLRHKVVHWTSLQPPNHKKSPKPSHNKQRPSSQDSAI